MMPMDGSDSLEPSRTPPQLSHTVRWIPWILWSSNTVAWDQIDIIFSDLENIYKKKQFFETYFWSTFLVRNKNFDQKYVLKILFVFFHFVYIFQVCTQQVSAPNSTFGTN